MRAKLFTLLAVIVLCGAAVAFDRWHVPVDFHADDRAQSAAGGPIVGLKFQTVSGSGYSLQTLPEKAVLLHFWASWCAPCAVEFPALLERVRAAHGRLGLVAVSIDDDRGAMQRFVAGLGSAAAVSNVYWVWDRDKAISLKQFDTIRVPETVMIGTDRRIAGKIAGDPGWDGREMQARLSALADR